MEALTFAVEDFLLWLLAGYSRFSVPSVETLADTCLSMLEILWRIPDPESVRALVGNWCTVCVSDEKAEPRMRSSLPHVHRQ